MDVRPFTLKENGNLIDNWIEGHKGSKALSANHEFPNSTRWKREGHIRMNKKRIPNVTSLTQPGGKERVVRMNKQWMPIVTSLTQPDGRERVVRMNKQWMLIVTILTYLCFVQRQSMTKDCWRGKVNNLPSKKELVL